MWRIRVFLWKIRSAHICCQMRCFVSSSINYKQDCFLASLLSDIVNNHKTKLQLLSRMSSCYLLLIIHLFEAQHHKSATKLTKTAAHDSKQFSPLFSPKPKGICSTRFTSLFPLSVVSFMQNPDPFIPKRKADPSGVWQQLKQWRSRGSDKRGFAQFFFSPFKRLFLKSARLVQYQVSGCCGF